MTKVKTRMAKAVSIASGKEVTHLIAIKKGWNKDNSAEKKKFHLSSSDIEEW